MGGIGLSFSRRGRWHEDGSASPTTSPDARSYFAMAESKEQTSKGYTDEERAAMKARA